MHGDKVAVDQDKGLFGGEGFEHNREQCPQGTLPCDGHDGLEVWSWGWGCYFIDYTILSHVNDCQNTVCGFKWMLTT